MLALSTTAFFSSLFLFFLRCF